MKAEKTLNIEVRGVGFVNKGAELMLQSIKREIDNYDPKANLVMEGNYSGGFRKATKLFDKIRAEGMFIKPAGRLHKISMPGLYRWVPKWLRNKWGVILEEEVNVILDASGFAFGDQWGAYFAQRRLTGNIERWSKQRKKIILLPQAFGPFNDAAVKKETLEILKYADLIFARDKTSYESLIELENNSEKIALYPDFTNLIKGTPPNDFNRHQVAIIPNFKMGKVEGGIERYKQLLEKCINIIQDLNFSPFFLIHEGEKDEAIANDVNSVLKERIPLITGKNALEIKGIIGATHAIITSRFHGLVSALSQGVPCLATSWSHKYKRLLEDYNYSEGLLTDLSIDPTTLRSKIEMVLESASNLSIKEKLLSSAEAQKKVSRAMWDRVFNIIDEVKKS